MPVSMTIFSGVFNQNGCKTGTSPLHSWYRWMVSAVKPKKSGDLRGTTVDLSATDVHPDSVHGVKIVQVLVLVLLPAQGPNQERPGSTAMCCGHEGSYRFDRTVAYVSRSRDTSWGTLVKTEVEDSRKYLQKMAYNDEACGSCAQEWEE
ncbi:hypothetical protein EV421DRAFT_2025947 [Armillaria borealis]|uniref:Uncharacterized protein n=1 Tax=Armillaria borealis TaxID=47425 RepID=A0AA39IUT1_9AGAR|nr:hypothetical protein EV421DRAFT_2025947 [Armillaria borealis]